MFGVLLWLTASFLFRVYLHFFNSYSQTYGSLGVEMILLLWFYVTGSLFWWEVKLTRRLSTLPHATDIGRSPRRESCE